MSYPRTRLTTVQDFVQRAIEDAIKDANALNQSLAEEDRFISPEIVAPFVRAPYQPLILRYPDGSYFSVQITNNYIFPGSPGSQNSPEPGRRRPPRPDEWDGFHSFGKALRQACAERSRRTQKGSQNRQAALPTPLLPAQTTSGPAAEKGDQE